MTRIEGLRTGNYKVLKDMTMGRLWHCRDKRPLTPLTAVLGKNGVGKSVLLEACSFLKDCVQSGVVDACDRRGGFSRIRSLGQEGPIEMEIQCREDGESRAVTYELAYRLRCAGKTICRQGTVRTGRRGAATRQACSPADTEWGKRSCLEGGTGGQHGRSRRCGTRRWTQAWHSRSGRPQAVSPPCLLQEICRGLVVQFLHPGRSQTPAHGWTAKASQLLWRKHCQCCPVYGTRSPGTPE